MSPTQLRPLVVVLLLASAASVASRARAEEGPKAAGAAATRIVTRDEALRVGAAQGPGIAVARAPRAGGEQALRAASSLPRGPIVTAVAGYRAGALAPGAEVGVTAMQELSLQGLGAARTRAARATIAAADADVARARLLAAGRAGFAHTDVLVANAVLALRTDAEAEAQAIVKTARARVGAGVAQPFEVAAAQGDLGMAKAALFDAEGARVEALSELRFALGLPPDTPVDAVGDLAASDEQAVDGPQLVQAAEASHPSLAATRARANLAKEEAQLAHATLSPPIAVGASYLHEGTGEQVVTGIVSFPLPFANPGAYDAARQTAVADTWFAHADAEAKELARDVRLALHDREHWREVRDALSTQAVVPVREAVRLARVQYEAGTQDISSVLLARQRLLATQEQLVRAQGEVLRADLRVRVASGTLLGSLAGGAR